MLHVTVHIFLVLANAKTFHVSIIDLCAQGTTLRRYFEKVAAHHGLEYEAVEFFHAEDPSSHHDHDDEATLYVTHLREPVARSISHFKCKL